MLDGSITGKGGVAYQQYGGFALETQVSSGNAFLHAKAFFRGLLAILFVSNPLLLDLRLCLPFQCLQSCIFTCLLLQYVRLVQEK